MVAAFVHWAARVLAASLVLFFGLFLAVHIVDHDAPDTPTFITICTILAGLLIGWKWEVMGGVLVIAGYLHMGYLSAPAAGSWPYVLCLITGVLLVISWFLRRRTVTLPV